MASKRETFLDNPFIPFPERSKRAPSLYGCLIRFQIYVQDTRPQPGLEQVLSLGFYCRAIESFRGLSVPSRAQRSQQCSVWDAAAKSLACNSWPVPVGSRWPCQFGAMKNQRLLLILPAKPMPRHLLHDLCGSYGSHEAIPLYSSTHWPVAKHMAFSVALAAARSR